MATTFKTLEVKYCDKCEKWLSEAEIVEVKVFAGNSREPAEYEERHEACGSRVEDMDEIWLDQAELADLLTKLKYLPGGGTKSE